MNRARPARLLVLVCVALVLGGCSKYTVYFVYPEERANVFNDRPETSLYVSEPIDLRPKKQREGAGAFVTLYFPPDDKLDIPASTMIRRALMQDLLTTRVARLVHNPSNADYLLNVQVLSMTTIVKRKARHFLVPLMTGVALGAILGADTSDAIKLGVVGFILGTFIPLPTETEGDVELRLELVDRVSEEVVWSTNCTGIQKADEFMSVSSRHDKKLAEKYLPQALKRANACAVGQLYQYLDDQESTSPADAESATGSG